MATHEGETQPTGQINVTRHATSALEKAIADASTIVAFDRAWVTAGENEDGTITTTVHATAHYSHRGDKRQCHVSFDVDGGDAIAGPFRKVLDANTPALVAAVMKDAAICFVAAANNSDVIQESN